MEEIPVTFTHKDKQYSGHFSKVAGAGSSAMFHLSVDGYYWGRLRYSDFEKSWAFDTTPKTLGLERLANEFGDIIVAWYE